MQSLSKTKQISIVGSLETRTFIWKIHKLLKTLHYCVQKTFSLAETVVWVILRDSLFNRKKKTKLRQGKQYPQMFIWTHTSTSSVKKIKKKKSKTIKDTKMTKKLIYLLKAHCSPSLTVQCIWSLYLICSETQCWMPSKYWVTSNLSWTSKYKSLALRHRLCSSVSKVWVILRKLSG